MKKDKIIATAGIVYCMIGLIFATGFAVYYKWEGLSFLSPGFYVVVLSWPLQTPGLIKDLLAYGLAGKPI